MKEAINCSNIDHQLAQVKKYAIHLSYYSSYVHVNMKGPGFWASYLVVSTSVSGNDGALLLYQKLCLYLVLKCQTLQFIWMSHCIEIRANYWGFIIDFTAWKWEASLPIIEL